VPSEDISAFKDGERAKTEVIYGPENIIKAQQKFQYNARKTWCVCADKTIPALSVDEKSWQGYLAGKASGVRIRYITEITKDNVSYCKKMMEVAELRHLDGIRGNFAVTESEYTDALKQDRGSSSPQFDHFVYSNVEELVKQQQNVFDVFWDKAIPAEQKIPEIEEGPKQDVVEIIQNRERAELLLLSGVENAKSEILAAISSFSFLSHLANIGLVNKMEQAKSNGARIMMICPNMPDDYKSNNSNDNDEGNNKNKEIYTLIADIKKHAEVQFRSGAIKGSVFVFDDNEIHTVDDYEKETRSFTVFSNSRSRITNYSSLFEYFWNEKEALHSIMQGKRELMESNALLLAANEQLTVNDKLQKEFINIAAHELRTPIQPILGVMDMYDISAKAEEEEEEEEEVQVKKYHMRVVARNAARLEHLSSSILDATRIENNALVLDMVNVDLVRLASEAIKDARKQAADRTEFILNKPEGAIFVDADWYRLTQVLANLLDNAVKFAPKGTISVTVEKTRDDKARITVADTGRGISLEIMSRLFQKFASKTDTGSGTGLGLFIAKAIVEAHGGELWAENNTDGKGATFYFTLPL
jgi:two-component system sensor histidine kinase VicK